MKNRISLFILAISLSLNVYLGVSIKQREVQMISDIMENKHPICRQYLNRWGYSFNKEVDDLWDSITCHFLGEDSTLSILDRVAIESAIKTVQTIKQ